MTSTLNTKFYRSIGELERLIALLDRRSVAIFYAGCAERLFPLYEHFVAKKGWGDAPLMRRILDEVWTHLHGGPAPDVDALLPIVERITPDGGQFPGVDSTFAQDVAICVDAALRAISSSERLDAAWVQYPLEATKVAVCFEDTGGVDVGSDDKAVAWLNSVVDNPKMKSDIDLYRTEIGNLSLQSPLAPAKVTEFQDRMRASRWQRDTILSLNA